MLVEKNTVVSLIYLLRAEHAEGDLIEQVTEEEPFVFLFGNHSLLPEFEQNLKGKATGNTFSFSIKSENAYGDFTKEAIINIPKHVFQSEEGHKAEEDLVVGNYLTLFDNDGNPLRGKVLQVNDETVEMDFNHPLASVNLFFEGEILNVRTATPEEISHGHVHGKGGIQH